MGGRDDGESDMSGSGGTADSAAELRGLGWHTRMSQSLTVVGEARCSVVRLVAKREGEHMGAQVVIDLELAKIMGTGYADALCQAEWAKMLALVVDRE